LFVEISFAFLVWLAAMRIIEEDLVDYEPLVMRFVAEAPLRASVAKKLASFVTEWFDRAAAADPQGWHWAKEWRAWIDGREVFACCELPPPGALPALAADVEAAFPRIVEIRLGTALAGPTTRARFDWIALPGGEVTTGGKTHSVAPLEISFTPVTLGQYQEFMQATQYTPVPDVLEQSPRYLVDHFTLNIGKSPKQPLFGVTHDDAVAYCQWAKLRLPSDPELLHFFEFTVRNKYKFDWSGECWTSTAGDGDNFVARDGPYDLRGLEKPDNGRYRKILPRHQYQFLEAPCFRVVKP
jgi:hypothetical protein